MENSGWWLLVWDRLRGLTTLGIAFVLFDSTLLVWLRFVTETLSARGGNDLDDPDAGPTGSKRMKSASVVISHMGSSSSALRFPTLFCTFTSCCSLLLVGEPLWAWTQSPEETVGWPVVSFSCRLTSFWFGSAALKRQATFKVIFGNHGHCTYVRLVLQEWPLDALINVPEGRGSRTVICSDEFGPVGSHAIFEWFNTVSHVMVHRLLLHTPLIVCYPVIHAVGPARLATINAIR